MASNDEKCFYQQKKKYFKRLNWLGSIVARSYKKKKKNLVYLRSYFANKYNLY